MNTRQNSGKVKRSESVGEDPDFDIRFRRDRVRRWLRGIRNGMNPLSLALFRMGFSEDLRFRGRTVAQSDNQATYRLVEDIWMRGEYDLPGVIPGPGWRVVEIGGNVGIYAMLCAARGATVETYEPDPDAFDRLAANAHGWPIRCHRVAVVGVPRPGVTLYRHPLRDTRNTLLGEIGGVSNRAESPGGAAGLAHAERVEVPAIAIARVLDRPCDLLKVACEGAEYEILLNAGDTLRRAARLVVELHEGLRTEAGGATELLAALGAAGFTVRLEPALPGLSRRFLTAIRGAAPC